MEHEVRRRHAHVVQHGAFTDVSDVYGATLSHDGGPPRFDADEVVWAADDDEIEAWLALFLPAAQHVETASHRVAGGGDTVMWDYRVPEPPQVQLAIPGLPSLSGVAEALVVEGLVKRLVLTSTPGVALLRQQAFARALAAAFPSTGRDAPARNAAASAGSRDFATPPPATGLVLALGCLAATACYAGAKK